MTRTYATFDCAMWDDPNGFPRLTAGAQRMYFMLVTQRDIAACGSLPLTRRRWASTCVENGVDEWLAELVEQRYVLIDEATEELLVRTFMRWDAGYKHGKRVQAVIASALAIRSLPIRTSALEELARLGVSVGNQESTESLRSVVTEVSTDHTPETSLREREPQPLGEDAEPPRFCSNHANGTEKHCGPCGTARMRHQRWEKREDRRQVEQRQAAAQRQTAAVLAELAEAKANAAPRRVEAS